jgi:(E)-4-hydroxy-3-methylbut-2-enyl-diphosphate synthase
VGHIYDEQLDKWHMSDMGVDFLYLGDHKLLFMPPNGLKCIYNTATWEKLEDKKNNYPLVSFKTNESKITQTENFRFIEIDTALANQEMFSILSTLKNTVLVVHTTNEHAMPSIRQFFLDCLGIRGTVAPVIIQTQVILKKIKKLFYCMPQLTPVHYSLTVSVTGFG